MSIQNLSNINSANPLDETQGGTGVSNSSTITLGGAFVTSGANALTLTTTGATNVTLPTTGTLTAGGITSVVTQIFTSSGTYTPTASMKYCQIMACGGGGGSGGVAGTVAEGGASSGGAGGSS